MSSTIETWLREILRCPACRSTLLDVTDASGAPALRCAADTGERCGRTYRFDRGVPVLLVDDGVLPTAATGDEDAGV